MNSETRLIGLVGGLGPAATIHYYAGLIAACARRGARPQMLIAHADVEVVLQAAACGDAATIVDHVGACMAALERGGAALIAVGAVTPHLCIRELKALPGVPVIDLLQVVDREVARRGFSRVLLLGTRQTVSSRLFGCLEGRTAPLETAFIDRIHDLYLELVAQGRADAAICGELRRLVQALDEELAFDALVIAGTDFALVPPEVWGDHPVIDCADAHIEAIAQAACAAT